MQESFSAQPSPQTYQNIFPATPQSQRLGNLSPQSYDASVTARLFLRQRFGVCPSRRVSNTPKRTCAAGARTMQCHFCNNGQKSSRHVARPPHYYLMLMSSTTAQLVSAYSRAVESPMLKYVILGIASLAFVGTAVAADLPRPQPVVQSGPVGKYPVGKFPVGKAPLGKAPVVTTRG